MSIDKELEKNILSIHQPKGTIEVKPHPEEIIDVDPAILALMQARLNGESFSEIYGDEDKVSQEFLIRKELEKLRRIFKSAEQVHSRFQSIKSIKDLREELQFEELNRGLLTDYAFKKLGGRDAKFFVDESDLYAALLHQSTPITKLTRFEQGLNVVKGRADLRDLLLALKSQYLSHNLEPIQITKEVIQLEPYVMTLVRDDLALPKMNDLLAIFYGVLV